MASPTSFASLAINARRKYRELIIGAVEGREVDPDEAQLIALAAGRSLPQLAADVARAGELRDAAEELKAGDWPRRLAEAQEEARRTAESREIAFEAVGQANQALDVARGFAETARQKEQAVRIASDQAARKLADLEFKLCERDASDKGDEAWKRFKLT